MVSISDRDLNGSGNVEVRILIGIVAGSSFKTISYRNLRASGGSSTNDGSNSNKRELHCKLLDDRREGNDDGIEFVRKTVQASKPKKVPTDRDRSQLLHSTQILKYVSGQTQLPQKTCS